MPDNQTTPGLTRDNTARDETGGGPVTDVYSGSVIKIDTKPTQVGPWTVDLPSGVSLEPGFVSAVSVWFRRRMIPFLIGLILTYVGAQLMARGDAETKVLGLEITAVGLSIIWFAYRDTTLVAWDAIKP